MTYNKVGFHIAANCGGCGGIETYWTALAAASVPFTVYAANDAGKIASALAYPTATLIYRDVEASTVNPADYARDPATAAVGYWNRTLARMPAVVTANRARVWIELLNEPGREPEQARWVGALMYHMARLALAAGWRVMGPGWAAGNPEPEAWETAEWRQYIDLCNETRHRVALSVHEYSLSNDIHEREPWLIGRFQQIYAACRRMGVGVPSIFITECGWTLNSMPPDGQAKRDIDYLSRLYGQYPEIHCAALWTLQSGAGNGNLPQRLNSLMPWLTEYSISRFDPDANPPDEPDGETPVTQQWLKNPSFEEGWTDARDWPGQHPANWRVEWNLTGGDDYTNPHSGQPYLQGEGVHKSSDFLPPHEHDVFIWDGRWTYKAFADGKCIWFRLKQSVPALPAGQYLLTTGVWTDTYRWDAEAKRKDYDVEPRHTEMQVKVNGAVVAGWLPLSAGVRHDVETLIDWPGGDFDLAVHFRCNWAISNNLWLDGWGLRSVITPPPPSGKHKVIIVKLPQTATAEDAIRVAGLTFANRHTTTFSHDDMLTMLQAGNADSYVKLVNPAQQPDVVALLREAGYTWVPLPINPLDGVSLGHILPYRYQITSPFNASRPYGLHEGMDYDVVGGAANNTTDVLALASGVVERVATATTGYGNQVRIRHQSPHDVIFYTRYAHLDRIYVRQGQQVAAGTPVGEIGQTGNATGEHVHVNIEVPGYGMSGYVVPDVIDPTPHIPPGAALPLVGSAIDTLPYIQGDGRIYEMTVRWQGKTYHQQMQTQVDGGRFYQVKNSEWEELWADATHIYRGADTSPGDGKYYIQYTDSLTYGAKWCPRFWQVGGIYERNPLIVWREKATGREVGRGNHRTWLKFVARHDSYKPVPEAVSFSDVVELAWLTGSSSPPAESYFYARGAGLVGWSSSAGDRSFVSAVYAPGERTPAVREKVAGL